MITFCIPSKNNLRYLKNSIKSIRKNSVHQNDVIVYVDSSNDGTVEWLAENGIKFILNETATPKGIAYAYNRCIEVAETEIICMFHADMYIGKDFDKHLIKHLKVNTVVAGTRIEPPIHPAGKEKIIKDFGMYPEDFKEDDFNEFVQQEQDSSKDKVTCGIFAPWACYKSDLLQIGLHDESFHSYHEDSDIFNRMVLQGLKCIQSRDALVYHLTCRGGQFQDGIEQITKDTAFHQMKNNAAKNYLRKWGSWIKNDEYSYPIIVPKYNIGFIINNASMASLSALEMWCTTVYIHDTAELIEQYIDIEQPNTKVNLSEKVLHFNNEKNNDILVEFDVTQINQEDFIIIQQLAEIIKDSSSIGIFQIGSLKITINSLTEYQNDLIKI